MSTPTPTAPDLGPRTPRRARLLAVVLVLAAATAAVVLGVQAQRASGVSDARDEALAAAQKRVPVLLGYDAATIDEDLARARTQTTGQFATDYGLILDAVAPKAKARQISTRAEVAAAGVVSGTRDKVVVLLFLTQTSSAGDGAPTVSGSRVEVTMVRAGDEWKIGGLQPV